MNSRKNSGAPGRLPNLASDNNLEVLCGNHAGVPASGEKPRIWWSATIRTWACWDMGDSSCGLGETPLAAYQDWALGKLTTEAQQAGLYAAPGEAQ